MSLDEGDVLKGITALVIADPRSAFSPIIPDRLQRYIRNGGNLLIAAQPDR